MKRLILCLVLSSPALLAGEVDIVDVRVECPSSCTFSVTLEHGDEGWNHYADQWDVLAPDGSLLESRVLYHPHVDEQPFTRSLSGIIVPAHIRQVRIRARDSRHGYSKREVSVDLPGRN